jgi:hypothetical protein
MEVKMKIRFRVWDPRREEMILPGHDGSMRIDSEGDFWCVVDEAFYYNITPMLSTGLHDAEGKEIFEGDTLVPVTKDEDPLTGVIKWKNGGFILFWESHNLHKTLDHSIRFYEIIGNIYETKNDPS